MLRLGTFVGVILVAVGFADDPAKVAPPKIEAPKAAEPNAGVKRPSDIARETRKALTDLLEIPEELRNQEQPLGRILEYLREKLQLRGGVQVVVEGNAFRALDPQGRDVAAYEVQLPEHAETLPPWVALNLALRNLPVPAAFIVKSRAVYVVPAAQSRVSSLLDREIFLNVPEMTLKDAIDEVADSAGVTILIDPRCDSAMRKVVRLRATRATPRSVLTSWADLYGLKLIADDHRALLMLRADYLRKLQNEAEESNLQAAIVKVRGSEGPPPPQKKANHPAVRGEFTAPIQPLDPALEKKAVPTQGAELRKVLREEIELPNDFLAGDHSFADVSQFLLDQTGVKGKHIVLDVDRAAFRAVNPDFSVGGAQIRLRINKAPLQDVLQEAIGQLEIPSAFIVKFDRIEIAPIRFTRASELAARIVLADFQNVPLQAAIDSLGAGINVFVDPSTTAKRTVTLANATPMSIRGVFTSWADLHDLKLVIAEDHVLIMPRADYLAKLRADLEEANLRQQIRLGGGDEKKK